MQYSFGGPGKNVVFTCEEQGQSVECKFNQTKEYLPEFLHYIDKLTLKRQNVQTDNEDVDDDEPDENTKQSFQSSQDET